MSLPNRRNLFQETSSEAWDDFFREEVPSLDDGEMKLTVCEIVEANGDFELRIDLPTEMKLKEQDCDIKASIEGQCLVVNISPSSNQRKVH